MIVYIGEFWKVPNRNLLFSVSFSIHSTHYRLHTWFSNNMKPFFGSSTTQSQHTSIHNDKVSMDTHVKCKSVKARGMKNDFVQCMRCMSVLFNIQYSNSINYMCALCPLFLNNLFFEPFKSNIRLLFAIYQRLILGK